MGDIAGECERLEIWVIVGIGRGIRHIGDRLWRLREGLTEAVNAQGVPVKLSDPLALALRQETP